MSHATIFIPSNRPLSASVEPIWSAINYAQANDMKVVISDNSGDAEKREYFALAPEHVTYLANGPAMPAENGLAALSAADSEFVLMLGDDDYIQRNEAFGGFDFSSVASDVIGVKPRIEVISGAGEVTDINDFVVEEDDAAKRIIEYTRKMRGGNSSYYSFFRRAAMLPIFEIIAHHHPTRIGTVDFAQIYALVASGKIIHDPATTIRYNNIRWGDMETATAAMHDIFRTAGLPEDAKQYMLLFHFLDSYVLMFRQSSNLPPLEQYKSGYAVAMVFLKRLLFRAQESPFLYAASQDLIPPLAAAVESGDPDLEQIFHVAGLIADRVKPGLKEQYDRYLLTVANGA